MITSLLGGASLRGDLPGLGLRLLLLLGVYDLLRSRR